MKRSRYRYIIIGKIFKEDSPSHAIRFNYITNKRIADYKEVGTYFYDNIEYKYGTLVIENVIRVV